jgi:hypothetical protein
VVLYGRLGKTHGRSTARTIDLVGRDRILGCVLG